MADAQYGEGRQFNLHSAGTDLVEGSAIAIKSSGGAITVDGFAETTINVLGVGGGTAHDAADTGYPLKTGGRARTSAITAVANNDRVDAIYTVYGSQTVTIVDSSGVVQPTGVQYIEDSALTADAAQGTLILSRRDDALATLTPVEGDAVSTRVNSRGALWIAVADGSGNQITSFGGGTQYVGDAAATSTPTGTMAIGLANAAAPTDVTANNDAVAAWYLRSGAQVSQLSAAGALIGGDATNGLDVDVTRTIGQFVGDAAATSTPTGIMAMGLASAAAPSGVSADNDAVAPWHLRNGAAATVITAAGALIGGDATNGLDVDVTRTIGQFTGDAAATSTPTGIMAMALANSAAPADVSANNDAVAPWALRNGSLVVNLAAGGTLVPVGGGTEATALRVTVATDSTGVLSVDDNGGSITVDGTVAVSGTVTTSDTATLVDNAAFTDGTSRVMNVGYIFDEVAGTALTENDVAAARIDSKRAQVGVIEDATTRGQRAAVSAAGALSANITQVGGSTHSATVPLFARMTDGTAVYSKTGQTAATASFAQLSDQTTAVGVIAGTTALKTDLSSVAGTATVTGGVAGVQSIGGPTAADAAIAANPVTIGGRGSTALPTAMSADGDVTNAWFSLNGALNVILRDTAGTYVSPAGGTQYVGDAAATATPTGTMSIGLANSAAPTDVSANNDAVAAWYLRNGSQVVNLASGGTLLTIGAKTSANSFPVVLASDQATLTVSDSSTLVDNAGFTDGTTRVAMQGYIFDDVAGTALTENDAAAARIDSKRAQVIVGEDATTRGQKWAISAAGALATNLAQVAGTTTVTSGLAGVQAIGGPVAHDAVGTGINPLLVGGYANLTAPSSVADGDAVRAWFGQQGQLTVRLFDNTGLNTPLISPQSDGDNLTTNTVLFTKATLAGMRSATATDNLRTLEALATASSTPERGLFGVGIPDRRYSAVTVATTGSTTLVGNASGSSHAMIRVNTTQTGAFNFEVTADGTNWISAETWKANGDVWVSAYALTPTSGDVYRVMTGGYQQIRATVTSTLGATVTMTPTLVNAPLVTSAHNSSAPPHSQGVTPIQRAIQFTTTQTGGVIYTPTTGRRLVVTYMYVGVGGTTAGTYQIWFGASGDTTYTRGTDVPIVDHEWKPSSTVAPGVVIGNGAGPIGEGALNDVLRITTSAAINPITVTWRGYETI
jgi:hypothetical protein